jgi:putative transposase
MAEPAASRRAIRRAWLTGQVSAVRQASHGTCGARRARAGLAPGAGIIIGHGTVELLMRRAQIKGLPGTRRPRPEHQAPASADLARRQFARPAADQLWVAGITGHPAREGKACCAVVPGTWSRRVAGWPIGSSQAAGLVTSALDMAIRNRDGHADVTIRSG